MRYRLAWLAAAGVLAGCSAPPEGPQVVLETGFEAGRPAELSGAGSIVGTEGYDGRARFAGQMWRNAAVDTPTTLTLSDLPPHRALRIRFDLAAIDSWDGAFSVADHFRIRLDGREILDANLTILPDGDGDERLPPGIRRLDVRGHLGFNTTFLDGAYRVDLAVTHEGPAAVIEILANGPGYDGGADESFAIDALRIEALPVLPP